MSNRPSGFINVPEAPLFVFISLSTIQKESKNQNKSMILFQQIRTAQSLSREKLWSHHSFQLENIEQRERKR